jgi:predicted TIM-barrel fold metal-dependent hydrolase
MGADAPHSEPAVIRSLQPSKTTRRSPSKKQVYRALLDSLETIAVIDAHEHLPIEPDRVARDMDVLALISQYNYADLGSAGIGLQPGEGMFGYNYLLDTDIPLGERWRRVRPHLENTKHGGFYRAFRLGLKHFYDIDDLTDRTYEEATRRIKNANSPGLYERVLRDTCHIEACLVQNGKSTGQVPSDLLLSVYGETVAAYPFRLPLFVGAPGASPAKTTAFVEMLEQIWKTKIRDLETYLDCLLREMEKSHRLGALGCKITSWPLVEANSSNAAKAFKRVLAGHAPEPVLQSTVLDFILQRAAEWQWPVAVHTGMWGDFRMLDPKHMIDPIMRYPEVNFDLYHLGIPYIEDLIIIAKNFPNAYLNLCWTYIISQEMTGRAIKEILDAVPVNKIVGFGGDYGLNVENVYGHLVMAKETLAESFSSRIAAGRLDLHDAERILRMWLYDNPKSLYRIQTHGHAGVRTSSLVGSTAAL